MHNGEVKDCAPNKFQEIQANYTDSLKQLNSSGNLTDLIEEIPGQTNNTTGVEPKKSKPETEHQRQRKVIEKTFADSVIKLLQEKLSEFDNLKNLSHEEYQSLMKGMGVAYEDTISTLQGYSDIETFKEDGLKVINEIKEKCFNKIFKPMLDEIELKINLHSEKSIAENPISSYTSLQLNLKDLRLAKDQINSDDYAKENKDLTETVTMIEDQLITPKLLACQTQFNEIKHSTYGTFCIELGKVLGRFDELPKSAITKQNSIKTKKSIDALQTELQKAGEMYFAENTSLGYVDINYDMFLQNCVSAIAEAHKGLSNHYSWAGILKELSYIILNTCTFGLAALASEKMTGDRLFFKTPARVFSDTIDKFMAESKAQIESEKAAPSSPQV